MESANPDRNRFRTVIPSPAKNSICQFHECAESKYAGFLATRVRSRGLYSFSRNGPLVTISPGLVQEDSRPPWRARPIA